MRVTLDQKGNTLSFRFWPEGPDHTTIVSRGGVVKARLLSTSARFHMPPGWRFADTHPDLLAAAILATAGEFARRRLRLPVPVSADFCDRVAPLYLCDVEPVDGSLKPRQPAGKTRIGLCYSGGVDSTAALALLPRDTVAVFAERVRPPGSPTSLYSKEAALRSCAILRQIGREVWTLPTDMEYIREPVGFFTDLATSAPLMLLADFLDLDAMAYGLILESSYLNKGFCFREYAQTWHWVRYNGVAAAVGLPWHLVTAGLSEVVTTRLVLESPLRHVAQSCVRSDGRAPCEDCWKCFRKLLLEAVLAGDPLPAALLDRYFSIHEAQKKLGEVPIKHEDVMMFILQRYRGNHPQTCALQRALRIDQADLAWIERWFTPARELLAGPHRAEAEATIARAVQPMNEQDVQNVRNWDRYGAAEAAGRVITAPRLRPNPVKLRQRKPPRPTRASQRPGEPPVAHS